MCRFQSDFLWIRTKNHDSILKLHNHAYLQYYTATKVGRINSHFWRHRDKQFYFEFNISFKSLFQFYWEQYSNKYFKYKTDKIIWIKGKLSCICIYKFNIAQYDVGFCHCTLCRRRPDRLCTKLPGSDLKTKWPSVYATRRRSIERIKPN